MTSRAASITLAFSPIIGIAGWSYYVDFMRNKPPYTTVFEVGSTDDLMADRLKTGDLLLFKRNLWLMQPFPAALAFGARHVFGTEFDHVGIIVKDRFGVPHVAEVTQLGVRFRRFDSRVLWSKSKTILAQPLQEAPSEEARARAERFVRSLTPERTGAFANPSHSMTIELAGLLKYYRGYSHGNKPPDVAYMGEALFSSLDTQFVLTVLRKMELLSEEEFRDMTVYKPPHYMTPLDFVQGKVPLINNRYLVEQPIGIR